MLRRGIAGGLLCALVAFLTSASAHAAPLAECPSGTHWNGAQCSAGITLPGADTPNRQPTSGARPTSCSVQGKSVPCSTEAGFLDTARGCYVKPVAVQPLPSDPILAGRPDGVLFGCTDAITAHVHTFIADAALPAASATAVATQLRDSMTFAPVEIGIVPEPGPDSVGLVGLPTWLWVANASPTVTGPQTRSLSAGGVDVTLTATVTSTRWEMGDGGVVTCRTAGTPYEDRFGIAPSPTCGYKYAKQGTYTVRAYTNWSATWQANTGEQGVFTWRVGSSTTITMGEAQVIITYP